MSGLLFSDGFRGPAYVHIRTQATFLKELADERLFFLSFANVHCSHQLKPVDVKVVNEPPPKARVNTALS